MQISEIMSRHPLTLSPDQTVREAAEIMERAECGFLPVGENDRLVGMLTDRDIAIRGVGRGKGPDCAVREAMTDDVRYCRDTDEAEAVARNMGEQQIRRLPVVDGNDRLVGVVSLGDLALHAGGGAAGDALEDISRPGGDHS